MMEAGRYPRCLEELAESLRHLPGVGKRTAERFVMAMAGWDRDELELLASRVNRLEKELKFCSQCGSFSQGDLCPVCMQSNRREAVICVVEQAAQVLAIEQTGAYKGLYHVLGGKLSPLNGVGPEELTVDALVERVKFGQIQEVIIAVSNDVEGEATASFLLEELRETGVQVSRPATGIPLGGDITYADAGTMGAAMSRRYTLS